MTTRIILAFTALVSFGAPLAQAARAGDFCYDYTSYRKGWCGLLSECEYAQELQDNRRPEPCGPGSEQGSSDPLICCPRYIPNPVYKEGPGKGCYHKTHNVRGTCLPLEDCETAKEEARNGRQPEKCDSGVCCVPSSFQCYGKGPRNNTCMCAPLNGAIHNRPKPQAIAASKCQEYSRFACPDPVWFLNKGKLTARYNDFSYPVWGGYNYVTHSFNGSGYTFDHRMVIMGIAGGSAVLEAKEYPHMALLGYGPRQQISFQCGGSLISPNFVLTAAHCKKPQWALLGTLNRGDVGKMPSFVDPEFPIYPQLHEVQEVIAHPQYNKRANYNDIALLRLKGQVTITQSVRPACLHTAFEDPDPDWFVIATGWGYTSDGEEMPSNALMETFLKVQPLTSCDSIIDNRRLRSGLAESHVCAGGNEKKDTCPGDSGGPLMLRMASDEAHGMFSILGVVSFGGLSCGVGQPAVYTRVASFVPWIESVVWPQG